jgi:hypothetical protein
MSDRDAEIVELLKQIAKDLHYLKLRAEEHEQAPAETTEIFQGEIEKDRPFP